MNRLIFLSVVLTGALFFVGCNKDDDTPTTKNLSLNISGLEDLGDDYAYEGWLIVDGSAVSAGIFDVDADGNLSQNTFELNTADIDNATAYVLLT